MADELVEAAQHGNVEKLKVFFKKGMDASTTRVQHACVVAAQAKHEEAVKVFLEGGVPLTCSDREGRRLIHTCARNDLPKTIKLMVSMKADVTKPDSDGALPISLAIKNKFHAAVKELLMGGATVPANAEMPGLAAIVMEVQLEQCGNEIRPLAGCEVDPQDILEAERSVLEGMQEHKRLLKLQEDSRAAKSLIELESHIKEEEETLEEIQKNSAGLIDELSQRKIDVRNAETELSKLRKELSSVLETFNETKEDDEKLKVELEENSRQLKEAGMSMLVNPEAQLLQEVMLKDQRAFAFKMLMLRRAKSNPSLVGAGSQSLARTKTNNPGVAASGSPAVPRHGQVAQPKCSPPQRGGAQRSKVRDTEPPGFPSGRIVYVRHRPKPFFSG